MDSRPKGDRDNHRGIQTSRIPDKNYFEGEKPRLDNKAGWMDDYTGKWSKVSP